MSSAITRRSRSDSGTSPSTIRWARPSTIAVLPTPGSPISTGLFLVRRERTWMTRRISSSRPMTGSSLPLSASAVRSRPNFSSAWAVSSGLGLETRSGRTSATAAAIASRSGRRSATGEALSASASSRWSVEMYSSPPAAASRSARLIVSTRALEGRTSGSSSPLIEGRASTAARARSRTSATLAPTLTRSCGAKPSSSPSRATSRCAGASSPLREPAASRCAAATASWALIVKRSACTVPGSYGF